MNAPQVTEIPRISATWYHFTRPSIARKITSCISIGRFTAQVRIPIKSATHSDCKSAKRADAGAD